MKKEAYNSIDKKHRKNLVASFKLFPNTRTRLYFNVHIWKDKKSYAAHTKYPKSVGCCSGYTVLEFESGKQKTSSVIGEINLIQKKLWTEILVHELSHATFRWCERKKIDISDHTTGKNSISMHTNCGEESFCYAQGHMVNSIVSKLYKLKLL